MPEIIMGTPASPAVGNWYQQFMPNIGGRTIQDITFLDSLTGYASARQTGDTSYILKTTNGGDNWQIIRRNFLAMTQMQFLNINTGYAVGAYIFKTTNGGFNWGQVTAPSISPEELYVLNEDTIWIISSNTLVGGVFRTTNGGALWEQQFSGGNQNPNRIYMYNARIGFMCNSSSASPNIYKTTNSGVNWNINLPGEYFFDIHFTDSLTGWKCMPGFIAGDSCVKKTTNGGINWFKQIIPQGGILTTSQIVKFSFVNKDTIWGTGGQANLNGGRGVLYRTNNGGSTWKFQIPDTGFGIPAYGSIQFINKNTGWAYLNSTGIHTTNGGDTTWLTPVTQISTEKPKQYQIFQNYPNPFNPKTNIKYSIISNLKGETSNVKLIVYDIQGKEAAILVNEKQSAGTYEVDFSGRGYSSGVYFYTMFINGRQYDSKKMILIK